ncbi:hypothetical protein SDRG_11464 [Saprolegnia diclina VS20]|uniref:Hook C-terminal domain-containing protein n=1 Tax=Saprolegnia diclina (strain VS20) TaxID=1156394 RepID=T0QAZ5_SAPDV|nr:hypothetical protein SDRG_11464 [Saprolegnia diclina VS20]EQC30705.1 hypothetical protein SDRG_11464 [Saprolegnia diclina VS20]|eukprot:XP_008615729.1 hypothetical protein SDRG_11464 [Saprolegnia diclina VS20]
MEQLWAWVVSYAPATDARLSDCVSAVLMEAYPTELDAIRAKEDSVVEWRGPAVLLNTHAKELQMKSYLSWDHLPSFTLAMKPTECTPAAAKELRALLEALCIAAFHSVQKATFVQDIINMASDVQEAVCEVLSQVSLSVSEPDAPPSPRPTTTMAHGAQETSPLGSQGDDRTSSSTRSEMHRLARENAMLKEEVTTLLQDAEDRKATAARLEADDAKRQADYETARLQMDVDMAKHERALKEQYRDLIKQLQNDVAIAQQKSHTLIHVETDLAALKDEMDVVRATAAKATKLEARLEKYKLKIDELPRLKECNKRLEEKNAELSDKVLAQETQLSRLHSVHRKLEEAKDAMATMAVRMSEMEATMARREHERLELRADLDAARLEAQRQQSLRDDLQATLAQLQDGQPVAISGERLELDHGMLEKMDALQHENSRLKKQLSAEAADRVESLLEELDALTRVKRSFETKYFATQDALEVMAAQCTDQEKTIESLRLTHADLEAQCETLQDKLNTTTTALATLAETHERSVDDAAQQYARLETEAAAHVAARDAQIQNLVAVGSAKDADMTVLRAAVASLTASLTSQTDACTALDEMHAALQASAHTLDTTLRATEATLAANVNELEKAYADHQRDAVAAETEKASLRSEFEVQREMLESKVSILQHVNHDMQHELEAQRAQNAELKSQAERLLEATAMLTEDVDGTRWQLDAARHDTRCMEAANASLALAIARLQTAHDNMANEWAKDQAVQMELHCEVAAKTETCAQLTADIDALRADMKTQQTAHDVLVDRNAELEAQVTEKAAVDARAVTLETALEAKTTALAETAGRLSAAEAQLTKLRTMEQAGRKYVHDLETHHAAALAAKGRELEFAEARFARMEARSRAAERERMQHHGIADARDPETDKQLKLMNDELELLKAEFKKLQTSYVALQTQLRDCSCRRTAAIAVLGQQEGLRRLQLLYEEEGNKLRELLLIKTQLVQDNHQLRCSSSTMAQELKLLKEKNSSLQLREARRERESTESVLGRKRPIDAVSPPSLGRPNPTIAAQATARPRSALLSAASTTPSVVESEPTCKQQ